MEQDDNSAQDTPSEPTQQQIALPEGSARQKSLVVAAFPWFHGQMLSANSLSDVVPADQRSLVSSDIYASQRLFSSEYLRRGW